MTDFSPFDTALKQHISLTAAQQNLIHQSLRKKIIKRKDYLLIEGEICTFEGFVVKGCLRSYFVNELAEEVNIAFATEGWWVGDICSFDTQTPGTMYIQALEDCELFLLHHEDKERLYAQIPVLERYFRILVQRHLSIMQQRLFATIAQPAPLRYESFIQHYPQLLQRIPLKQIASYLGISPEFLSKIRKMQSQNATKNPTPF